MSFDLICRRETVSFCVTLLNAARRQAKIPMRAGTVFVLFTLAACSSETFTGIEPASDSGKDSERSNPPDAKDGETDSGNSSTDSGDSSTDAKPTCPDPNDVEHGGHCYYLDGSKGVCDQGYMLSSNAKLASILAANANAWNGKSYKHTPWDNWCVLTSDNVMNYGLKWGSAPVGPGEPVQGGSLCWMVSPPLMKPKQLTLCESQ